MVTNELRGERVDIVPFSDDPVEFIQAALQPARVREVRLDDETGTATVIVSDYQLSLAIGKEGQNARLAARLTGWRIDIKSETQLAEEEAGYAGEEWAEGEWVENEAGEMVWQPAEGGEAVSAAEWSRVGVGRASATTEPGRARPPTRRRAVDGRSRPGSPSRSRPVPRPRSRSPTRRSDAEVPGEPERHRHSAPPDLHRVPAAARRPSWSRCRWAPTDGWSLGPRPGPWRLAVPGLAGVRRPAVRRQAFERALRAEVAPGPRSNGLRKLVRSSAPSGEGRCHDVRGWRVGRVRRPPANRTRRTVAAVAEEDPGLRAGT